MKTPPSTPFQIKVVLRSTKGGYRVGGSAVQTLRFHTSVIPVL